MKKQLLEKIDWPNLLKILANFSQSEEAKTKLLDLKTELKKEEILKSWEWINSLTELMNLGHSPKIGAIEPIEPFLKSASLERILEGEELNEIATILSTTQNCLEFLLHLPEKNSIVFTMKDQLDPCKKLFSAINQSIDEKGDLKETASKILRSIHQKRKTLSKKIQQTLQSYLNHHEKIKKYLQDDYFTIRLGRYVIPIRVDGKGRIPGTIIDSSVSSQTLFIEPQNIKAQNDELIELDQLEKIEKMRILKELSFFVKENIPALRKNYKELITLDCYTAKAFLAQKTKANRVKISDQPKLSFIKAHHPLLYFMEPKNSKSNNISLRETQNTLVISGPNAGGKSVVLKTIALLQVMASSGLLLPCDENSEIYLFKNLYVELGDSQSIADSLSSFSGHISNLKPILERSTKKDLILLDELASGTEPLTGASIAQAILEELNKKEITVVTTTHFDNLKFLAFKNNSYRNGSMEYSVDENKPTYKLLLDIPGQSFGFELASRVGIGSCLIKRAQEIKGTKDSSLELLLQEISQIRDKIRKQEDNLNEQVYELEMEKASFASQTKKLKERKQQEIDNIRKYYEQKLGKKYEKIAQLETEFKRLMKDLRKSGVQELGSLGKINLIKRESQKTVEETSREMRLLGQQGKPAPSLPGIPYKSEIAKVGDIIYVIHLKKEGKIIDLISPKSKKIEISVGPIRTKVDIKNLRFIAHAKVIKELVQKNKKKKQTEKTKIDSNRQTFQTSTNTISVRGMRSDEALDAMWKFIDSALLRSEICVYVIHGHGDSNILKDNIRKDLKANPNMSFAFKAAEQKEGGDGVTIVFLN